MSELVRFLSGDNDVAQKTQMDPQNPTAKFVPLEPGQVLFGLEVVEDVRKFFIFHFVFIVR